MKIVLSFEPSNEDDAKLYEWIKKLGYGEYTAGTKEYWRKRMAKGKKYESEMESEANWT